MATIAQQNFNLRKSTDAASLQAQIAALKKNLPLIQGDAKRRIADIYRNRKFELGNIARQRKSLLSDRDFQLANIAREIGGLKRSRTEGLRDIDQARVSQLRQVVSDALNRGIYRSGIRTENEGEVEREASEASETLKANIAQALAGLSAQQAQINAQSNLALQGLLAQQNELISSSVSQVAGINSAWSQTQTSTNANIADMSSQLKQILGTQFDSSAGGGGFGVNIDLGQTVGDYIDEIIDNVTEPGAPPVNQNPGSKAV